MQDLTVTLIQTELFWEDIPANFAMFDQKINAVSEKTATALPIAAIHPSSIPWERSSFTWPIHHASTGKLRNTAG
jgi:hypothetical protein